MGGPATVQTVGASNWELALRRCGQLWRPSFVAIAVALLYASVLVRLANQLYENPNYSHGLAIPFFCGYLIWLKRDRLARIEKKPSLFGLFVVLGAIGVLYLGNISAELFLTRISLVLV